MQINYANALEHSQSHLIEIFCDQSEWSVFLKLLRVLATSRGSKRVAKAEHKVYL